MTDPYWTDGQVTVYHGDCLGVLPSLGEASVDAIVTDPPYGLEFMGKDWAAPWEQRAGIGEHNAGFGEWDRIELADGAQRQPLPSFIGSTNPTCRNCGGTRRGNDRQSRRACACDRPEFPNTVLPRVRAFQAWCQAWANECLRVLRPGGYLLAFGGTRTYHRLACGVEDAGFEVRDSIDWLYGSGVPKSDACLKPAHEPILLAWKPAKYVTPINQDGDRWPPNVVLSPDAVAKLRREGGASQVFPVFRYEPKAAAFERPRGDDGTAHPAVKPAELVRWLVRLVTPPDGLVLDCFAGSGTTGEACIAEGFRCLLIEKEAAYAELIRRRLDKPIQPVLFGGVA